MLCLLVNGPNLFRGVGDIQHKVIIVRVHQRFVDMLREGDCPEDDVEGDVYDGGEDVAQFVHYDGPEVWVRLALHVWPLYGPPRDLGLQDHWQKIILLALLLGLSSMAATATTTTKALMFFANHRNDLDFRLSVLGIAKVTDGVCDSRRRVRRDLPEVGQGSLKLLLEVLDLMVVHMQILHHRVYDDHHERVRNGTEEPDVNEFEVGSFGQHVRRLRKELRQDQKHCEGHHHAVGEVVPLEKEGPVPNEADDGGGHEHGEDLRTVKVLHLHHDLREGS